MVDVIASRHEQFMGFRRPSRIKTEKILRNPSVGETTNLGEFFYEDLAMDVFLAEAEIGHAEIPPGDFFGIAVDARQTFAIVLYDLTGSENRRKVEKKLTTLVGGDFNTVRELENTSSMVATLFARSQFDGAF